MAIHYIVAASLLWSTIGVAAKFSGDPICMAVVRAWSAALVSLAIYRSLGWGPAVAGVLLGILFATYPLAAVTAGVGAAAFLLYTAPAWATLVSMAFGERPGRLPTAGLIVVMAAASLMGLEAAAGRVRYEGFVLGLSSGFAYGTYIAVARRLAVGGKPLDASMAPLPYAAATTTVLAPLCTPSLESVAAGIYTGILATVVAYMVFVRGLERLEASRASIVATTEPVFAAIWGLALFNEVPSPTSTAAYALIIVAAALASARGR